MRQASDHAAPPEFRLSVDSQRWTRISGFESSGPDDEVYVLDRDSGRIAFGDGVHGKRPSEGSRVSASYRFGGDQTGNAGSARAVSVEWKVVSDAREHAIAAIHEHEANGAIFQAICAAQSSREWSIARLCLADALRRPPKDARKVALGDLVLAVLPWPFHKDLPSQHAYAGMADSRLGLLRLLLCRWLCPSSLAVEAGTRLTLPVIDKNDN